MISQTNSRLLFPEIKFSHRVKVQIRFADYDTFGHINNNSYMAYLDLGKSEYLCEIMGRRCAPSDLSAAIVNINVDFLAPTTLDETLEVVTAAVRLGEHSFTLYQRVINPVSGIVKVQASSTLAGFDIVKQSSAPLQQPLVEALRADLGQI